MSKYLWDKFVNRSIVFLFFFLEVVTVVYVKERKKGKKRNTGMNFL